MDMNGPSIRFSWYAYLGSGMSQQWSCCHISTLHMETFWSFAHTQADNTQADSNHKQQHWAAKVQVLGTLQPLHGLCCCWDQSALLRGQALPLWRRKGKAGAMLLVSAEHGWFGDCSHNHAQYQRLPSVSVLRTNSTGQMCPTRYVQVRRPCQGPYRSCSVGAGWQH